MKTIAAAALGLSMIAGAASAQAPAATQAPVLQAQRGSVTISKDDIAKALAGRAAGAALGVLGVLGAIRAGDDRIMVDVLRRDNGPNPEGPVMHSVVTEIYYIIEGGGGFETGGSLVNPEPMLTNGAPTNPANIGPSQRSATMTGGAIRHVSAGDVIMIPPGIVHRFATLDDHVVYVVVRVNPDYEKGK